MHTFTCKQKNFFGAIAFLFFASAGFLPSLARAQTPITPQLLSRPYSSTVDIYTVNSVTGRNHAYIFDVCPNNTSRYSGSDCSVGTGQDNCLMTCPGGSAACGEEFVNGNWTVRLLCCSLTSQARDLGISFGPNYYSADSDQKGTEVDCFPVPVNQCDSQYGRAPTGALVGAGKVHNNGQIDFGFCASLSGGLGLGPPASPSITDPTYPTIKYCRDDEVACGGKMKPGSNSTWDAGILCCKVIGGTLTVHAFKEDDSNTDVGISFGLVGPVSSLSGATLYTNTFVPRGTYSLSVPAGTETAFQAEGYTICKMYSTVDPTEVDCLGGLTSGNVDVGQQIDFFIKFSKSAPQCKTCDNVATGGTKAQCGKFPDGCSPCDPTSQDPAQTAGCLDCGTCAGPGEVCTPEGKCTSEFDVSCTISPAVITAGESADFAVQEANGTEPYACAWQSQSPLINGKNTCTFTQTFANPGMYDAAVTVTDSSSPQKTKTAQCTLTVNPTPAPPIPPPPAIIPNYSLCEMYKVLIRYGLPFFGIMIVIAGLYILMSLGDPSRITKGKQALSAGVAGVLVLLLAKPIFMIIVGFLGFKVLLCGTVIP